MFGFFGNIVALVMFVRDNQFRSTVDMLLVNLAFADIGMCGLCFPFVSASNFAQVRIWTSELLKLPSFKNKTKQNTLSLSTYQLFV